MLSSSKCPQGNFPGQSPSGKCRLELYSIVFDGIQMKSKLRLCRLHWRVSTALKVRKSDQETQGSCSFLLCPFFRGSAQPDQICRSSAQHVKDADAVSVGQHPFSNSSLVPLTPTWTVVFVCRNLAFYLLDNDSSGFLAGSFHCWFLGLLQQSLWAALLRWVMEALVVNIPSMHPNQGYWIPSRSGKKVRTFDMLVENAAVNSPP